jgi:hypothetical protein
MGDHETKVPDPKIHFPREMGPRDGNRVKRPDRDPKVSGPKDFEKVTEGRHPSLTLLPGG